MTASNSPPARPAAPPSAQAKAVAERLKTIQEIFHLMKEGVHYGIIPGSSKPSLYKAGSEMLLTAFRIAVKPVIETIRAEGHITHSVTCNGEEAGGIFVGAGVGECSTAEDEYAWRRAVCEEEFQHAPEDRRRIKWLSGDFDKQTMTKGEARVIQQVRLNPADLSNTVLKMAKKRAQIDLCLTALGASDIFTQDIEDLPAEYLQQQEAKPARGKPKKAEPKTEDKPPEAPPGMDPVKFEIEFLKWTKLVQTGKKTAADIIATAATKHPLNATQRERVEALSIIPI